MSAEALVSVRSLCVDFHTEDGVVHAVQGLDFEIGRGETVGLVGESGSGKSVTALAMMRLILPPGRIRSGRIDFAGENLLELSERRMQGLRGKRIGMIFQEPMTSLNPVYRVGDQVAEVLVRHEGMSRRAAARRAIELLDQVGIPDPARRARSFPHELSGGQRQRVMIAQAMACKPDLLIADEPTTALDVTIQKQVLELMKDLQRMSGMSLLFITHDLGVIAELADRVVVMYRSRKVEEGSTRDIFTRAAHPYTRGLIACRPAFEGNPRRLLTVADFMDAEGRERTIAEDRRMPQVKRDEQSLKTDPVLLDVQGLKTHFTARDGWFARGDRTVKAVDGVSFTLRRGQTLGLVGESGCGKTTLGRSLLRLIEPKEGRVSFDGVDVTAADEQTLRGLRRRMQIVFQDPYSSLNPRMTVGEILTEPMSVHGIGSSRAERADRARALLQRVGLNPGHLNRYPHEFSGGQRQRIGIARALAVEPQFIVCDESVSALDVSVQAQILNLLLDLQEEYKLTYLVISHDLGVIHFISDYVGVMHYGKLVEYGTADRIYRQPEHEYTRKLLSAVPQPKF